MKVRGHVGFTNLSACEQLNVLHKLKFFFSMMQTIILTLFKTYIFAYGKLYVFHSLTFSYDKTLLSQKTCSFVYVSMIP